MFSLFYWFGRELRVIAAPKEHESALGAKVVKIGGLDIGEVAARIASCFPSKDNENEWYVLSTSPAFLVRPEVLHTLGIVPDLSRAAFTVEDDAGRQSTFEISPVVVLTPQAGYPSLKQNAQALFAFIDRNPTSQLVIDLRQNGGGDFFEGREHLIEPIKKRPAINQKGRLFVVIGRRRFPRRWSTRSIFARTRMPSWWANRSANGPTAIRKTTK